MAEWQDALRAAAGRTYGKVLWELDRPVECLYPFLPRPGVELVLRCFRKRAQRCFRNTFEFGARRGSRS